MVTKKVEPANPYPRTQWGRPPGRRPKEFIRSPYVTCERNPCTWGWNSALNVFELKFINRMCAKHGELEAV